MSYKSCTTCEEYGWIDTPCPECGRISPISGNFIPPDEPNYSHESFKERLHTTLTNLEELVAKKNLAYGNSYEVVPSIMKTLYPEGITPEQLEDALLIVRLLDKLKRIVTNNDPLGEDPWQDIAGYAVLKLVTRNK